MTPVDHAYIEEHDLYEAYLAERLSPAERDAFEAHYFDCEECVRRLEMAEDFRAGMKDAGAAAAASAVREARDVAPLGLLAALSRLSRARRIGLASALLLLLALPGLVLWRAAGRSAAERVQGERRIAELEGRLRGFEGRSEAERRSLEAELARERRARAEAEAKGTAAAPTALPQVNVPIYVLAAVRGAEEGREPVNRLSLPRGGGSLVVTLELATVDFPTYRVRLRDGAGREVWQAGGLRPDGRDTLVLLLPSSLLRPGIYHLALDGERPGGGAAAAGAYPFRVLAN